MQNSALLPKACLPFLPQGSSLVVADVGDSLAVLGREEGDEYVGDIGEQCAL